ncbi:MAG: DUF427 domain-containing protein [Pseudomonadota bacterium]
MRPSRIPPGPNQESVWDYPRPAIAEPVSARLRIEFAGRTIADTSAGIRTIETSHPPTYYFPRSDVDTGVLRLSQHRSFCEWKGQAEYFDLVLGDRISQDACWSYPSPSRSFASITGFIAFYPARVDACFVDDERARPQPGHFYGGWITNSVVGPFKGDPGTLHW